jgi:hypothetical protein
MWGVIVVVCCYYGIDVVLVIGVVLSVVFYVLMLEVIFLLRKVLFVLVMFVVVVGRDGAHGLVLPGVPGERPCGGPGSRHRVYVDRPSAMTNGDRSPPFIDANRPRF